MLTHNVVICANEGASWLAIVAAAEPAYARPMSKYRLPTALLLFVAAACGSSEKQPMDASPLADTAAADFAPADTQAIDSIADSQVVDAPLSDALLGDASALQHFVGDLTEAPCDGVLPVCLDQYAGCVLDETGYVLGNFPGSRKVVVETPTTGDWKIRLLIFFDPDTTPRYPGTELDVSWYEPGCAEHYSYSFASDATATGDLFEVAGEDNVIELEHDVVEAGQHLVTVFADATTRYALRVQVLPTP